MRIGFWLLQDNIQHWQRWVAGLYYVRHCMEAMATLPVEEIPESYAFLPESLMGQLEESELLQRASWLHYVTIPDEWIKDVQRRGDLKRLLEGHRCDVYFPLMTPPIVALPGRMVGWIADYQHRHYPEFFSTDELRYRDELFVFLATICDVMVSSSQVVNGDFARYFPQHAGKGRVLRFTMHAGRALGGEEGRRVLQRHGIGGRFAYLPYQFWVHKNHQVVFEAWEQMVAWGREELLVCSGVTTDPRAPEHFSGLEKWIAERGLGDRIRILGMVDRVDQWTLYGESAVVIQPSLFEGWSTSVEEVKAMGRPLLLSDIPVHREQVQNPACFFEPGDARGLAERLVKVLDDESGGGAWIPVAETSGERAQAFGRELIGILRECCEGGASVARDILPLYTHYVDEANARLVVIEQLVGEIERLRGVVAVREQELAERSHWCDQA